jgi:hypothetical protein
VAAEGATSVVEHPLAQSGLVNGAPLYALDSHTRLGRQAIQRFGRENAEIAQFVARHAPASRDDSALRLAVFYADSALTRRRLHWEHSAMIEKLGVAADFSAINVAAAVGARLINLVHENIAHLNAIRARLLTRDWLARRQGTA